MEMLTMKDSCWSGAQTIDPKCPGSNWVSFHAQVTDGAYIPVSSMNGAGFRPFDMVIPFTLSKGEITGEEPTQSQPRHVYRVATS